MNINNTKKHATVLHHVQAVFDDSSLQTSAEFNEIFITEQKSDMMLLSEYSVDNYKVQSTHTNNRKQ